MAGQQMKIAEFISQLHLDRVVEPLLKQTAEFGFESLEDLKHILPEEVNEISDAVRMNNFEHKRFLRGIANLQGQQGQMQGVSGDAGWRAEPDPQQVKRQQEELALKRQQEELAKQKMELERQKEELHQQMLQVRDEKAWLHRGRVEWYQVLKSMAHIKNTPHKDAKTIATPECGRRLQVSTYHLEDDEHGIWVELTEWEMRRCGLEPPAQGYALIDGSHLKLGLILKKCDPEEPPETTDQEPSDSDEEFEGQQVPAAPQNLEAVIASNWEAEMVRLKKTWAMEPPLKGYDHVIMSVNYASARGTVCLFRGSISRKATVLTFRAGFCSVTGLRAKSTMLAMLAGESSTAPFTEGMSVSALDTQKTLQDYGFKEHGTVNLVYIGNFEEDYDQGSLLRE